MHLWLTFILRYLRQEPFRALSTLVGIALGITVIIAIALAKESSVAGFQEAMNQVAGRAALEISAPGGLPENRIAELAEFEKYGPLCPMVTGEAMTGDLTLQILGVDILRDQEVRDYELVDFGGGRTQPSPTQFLALLNDPSAVILTEKLAKRRGWKVGDTVPLMFADQKQDMRIAALLMDQGAARAMEGNVALMDIAAAQWRLGKLGRIDRMEIRLRDGLNVDDVEKQIAAKLSPGLNVARPSRRGSEVEKMLSAYHFNLTLLSGIAFLAGLYVIYNSVSLAVIGRRVEIGMLRTLGVSRAHVAWLFLGEAAALAIPGCLLGLLVGQGLGHQAVKLTQLTTTTLYGQQPVFLAPLTFATAVPVTLVGVLLAMLAALRPALEAARLAPVTAVRNAPEGVSQPHRTKRRVMIALGLSAASFLACKLPTIGGLPIFGVVASLLAVAAASSVAPLILQGNLFVLRKLMTRRCGTAGLLAWGNLAGGQHRLAIPVSALGSTLALTTSVAIMVGSFRETLIYWVDNNLSADLYVRPGNKKGVGGDVNFSGDTVDKIKAHSAVLAMDVLRNFDLPYEGSRIVMNTADFQVGMKHAHRLFRDTSDWRGVLQACCEKDAVIISEPLALRYHLKPGDTISLPTPLGAKPFRVEAIYYDYSNDRGSVTLDHSAYERYFGPVVPTNIAVFLRPGSDPDATRDEILERLGAGRNVQIFTNVTLRAEVMRIFERSFSITWALESIAILVAMAGVAATVFTLVLERREELLILRQVGASRSQLHRTLAMEGAVIGGMSQIIGVGLGLVLSLILIYVINVQSFGWTLQFKPSWALLGWSSVAVPLATALAGWLFAARILRRALRPPTAAPLAS